MIDRIPGTSYYGQSQPYEKKVKSNTETFSMEGRAGESVYGKEKPKKEKSADSSVIEKLLSEEGDASNGVELDISNHRPASTDRSDEETERAEESFAERLRNLWTDIKAAFIRFFRGGVEVVSEHEITVEESPKEDEVYAEEPNFAAQEQMRTELLERLYGQGERTLAKNSDLLTSYDKHGTIVKMNAGDRNRILHMHPNHIDKRF